MADVELRLRDYGQLLDEECPEISVDELQQHIAALAASDDPGGDDPTVEWLWPIEERTVATRPTRGVRAVLAVAAAAAILVVVGVVVVVPDPSSDDVVTAVDSSPTVADPASPPGQAGPVPSTRVVDSLGYGWSRVPHDGMVFGGAGTQWMEGVTVGGPGLVAVGSSGRSAAVWTSTDGLSWDRVPHDDAIFGSGKETSMLSVTAGGSGLVAVGYEGSRFSDLGPQAVVWTSVDGLSWSRVRQDETVFAGTWMKAVTAGGPGLVAVGAENSGAAVWTSVDGLTWSRVTQDTSIFGCPGGQGFGMTAVTVGGPGLVAGGLPDCANPAGAGTAVWTSVDGLTWSRVPDSTGPDGFLPWGVTAGGPGLVAVGFDDANAVVWTSADGLTWSRVPNDDGIFGGQGDLLMSMNSVTGTGQGLVAVGFGAEFGCCGSGPGGSKRQQPGEGPLTSGSAVVWTSVDGVRWSRVPHDDAVFGEGGGRWTGITSVTDFGSSIVAVGADKTSGDVDAAVWIATFED